MNRILLFTLLFILALSGNVFAQDASEKESREDFFIGPLAEALLYSRNGISFGGGFVCGAGDGAALGIRILYGMDFERIAVLELNVFLRFYLMGPRSHSGPFIQANAGPVLFAHDSSVSFPSKVGSFSAGLSVGWRFLFGDCWYMEPYIRAGYPYMAGGGISAGFRM